jgi:Icc-related predicted phosphoesterase
MPGRAAHDASVGRVLRTVERAFGVVVAFVPGNHDLRDPPAHDAGVNVDGRYGVVSGFTIAGLGGAGPTPFGFPYEWSETEADASMRRALGESPPAVDILLSHTPPRSTPLDRTRRGSHVGSRTVRSWIARVRPRLFLCGHIHEAWGATTIDGVPCVNAGALGEPYPVEIVWRIAWDTNGPTSIRSVRRTSDGRVEERVW